MTLKNIFLKNILLFIIAFVEGGIVLAAEVMTGNLLNAAYGTSVFLWSGIIGISLMGLATGYFIAPRITSSSSKKELFILLAGIGLFTALIPLINSLLIPLTAEMNLRMAVFIGCFILLFPLMSLCGIISPYLIRVINSRDVNVGSIAGMVFSISTLGGVIFMFFYVFLLIPSIGLTLSFFSLTIFIYITGFLYLLFGNRSIICN